MDILQFPFRYRQKKALQLRDGATREAFALSLADDEFERTAALRIWDLLTDSASVEGFKPLPDDNFHHIYGLAEEDLDEDIIMLVLKEMNLPIPPRGTVNAVGPINSPRDLMNLLRESRREAGIQ